MEGTKVTCSFTDCAHNDSEICKNSDIIMGRADFNDEEFPHCTDYEIKVFKVRKPEKSLKNMAAPFLEAEFGSFKHDPMEGVLNFGIMYGHEAEVRELRKKNPIILKIRHLKSDLRNFCIRVAIKSGFGCVTCRYCDPVCYYAGEINGKHSCLHWRPRKKGITLEQIEEWENGKDEK